MAFRGRNMLIKVSAEERYFETVSIDSPIAYYRLGELAGTVAVDEIELQNGIYELSPNLGVNGLLSNDPNKAVSMDGSTVDHNVNLTNTSNFSFPSAPFSLEAFIALDNMTNKNPIIKNLSIAIFFLPVVIFAVELYIHAPW